MLDPPGAWWRDRVAGRRRCRRTSRAGAACSGSCGSQLRTSAPLGVFVRTRVVRVAAAASDRRRAARDRSPPAGRCSRLPDERSMPPSRSPLLEPGGGDTVRAVRPYVPGDAGPPRALADERAARRARGARARAAARASGVALVVDLTAARRRRGRRESRARASARATLAAGGVVWCCTCEDDGPVGGARRRRARPRPPAGPRRPPAPCAAAAGLARRGGAGVSDPRAADRHCRALRRAAGGAVASRSRLRAGSGIVAVPAAIALGSVGAIAAERAHCRWLLGALGRCGRRAARRCSRCRRCRRGASPSCCSASAGSARCVTRRSRAPTQLAARRLGGGDAARARARRPRRRRDAFPRSSRGDARSPRAASRSTRVGRGHRGRSSPSPSVALGPDDRPTGSAGTCGRASTRRSATCSTRRRRCARADQLDMTDATAPLGRGRVHRRRARADFWRGETFDTWDGRSVDAVRRRRTAHAAARDGNTVHGRARRRTTSARSSGRSIRQTFHVESRLLRRRVRGAEPGRRSRPTRCSSGTPDGTVARWSSGGFGKGAVYTVTSRSLPATAATAARGRRKRTGARPRSRAQYAQTPRRRPTACSDLAPAITAAAPTTYDKIRAIEAWLGANTTVLARTRRCRRPASTSSTTSCSAAASAGASRSRAASSCSRAASASRPGSSPASSPGERDALTGASSCAERDAHAWAEIYFPASAGRLRPDRVGAARGRRRRRRFVAATARGTTRSSSGSARGRARAARRRRAGAVARARGAGGRRRRRGAGARRCDRLERVGRKAGRARRAGGDAARVRACARAMHLRDERTRARSATRSTPTRFSAARRVRQPRGPTPTRCYPRSDREGDPVRSLRRRTDARRAARRTKPMTPVRRPWPERRGSFRVGPRSTGSRCRPRLPHAASSTPPTSAGRSTRIAHEIVERNHGADDVVLVGLYTRGRRARPPHRRRDRLVRGGRRCRSARSTSPSTATTSGCGPVAPLGPDRGPRHHRQGRRARRRRAVHRAHRPRRARRAARARPAPRGAARGAGRPRPPRAADARRLRRQEPADRDRPKTCGSGSPRSTAATTASSSGAPPERRGRGREAPARRSTTSPARARRPGLRRASRRCSTSPTRSSRSRSATSRRCPRCAARPSCRSSTRTPPAPGSRSRPRPSGSRADTMTFSVVDVVGEEGREPARHRADDRGDGRRRDRRAPRAPPARRTASRRGRSASVVNAGDGRHEHPTQALLDAFTLRRHRGPSLDGCRVAIVGDIAQLAGRAQRRRSRSHALGCD